MIHGHLNVKNKFKAEGLFWRSQPTNCAHFMQNKASFLCLQQPTTGYYAELNELIPQPSNLFLFNHFLNTFQSMHTFSKKSPLFRFPNHNFLSHVVISSQININTDNSSSETDTRTRTCRQSLCDWSKHQWAMSQSKLHPKTTVLKPGTANSIAVSPRCIHT